MDGTRGAPSIDTAPALERLIDALDLRDLCGDPACTHWREGPFELDEDSLFCAGCNRRLPWAAGAIERIGADYARFRTPIGEGNMAVVYAALYLGRDALQWRALKESRPAVDARRIQREGRASDLLHEGIVRVYDPVRHGSRTFLAMELLRGEPLLDWLRGRGPLPLAVVLQVLGPVAGALDLLREKGVVHGDLKPENLRFARKGGQGLKLLDFGVTHWQGGTHTGLLYGTEGYLAPEQRVGRREAASDVYALARIVWELLTGERPLPPRYRERLPPLQEVRPQAPQPPGLQAILDRALAADPAQRPQAGAFFQALAALLAPPPPRRAWSRRAALAAGVVLLGGAAALLGRGCADPAGPRADAARATAPAPRGLPTAAPAPAPPGGEGSPTASRPAASAPPSAEPPPAGREPPQARDRPGGADPAAARPTTRRKGPPTVRGRPAGPPPPAPREATPVRPDPGAQSDRDRIVPIGGF